MLRDLFGYQIKFDKKGNFIAKTGKRKDKVIKLDPLLLASDPIKTIDDTLNAEKEAYAYSIMVNGFSSKHLSIGRKAFFEYMADKLFPEWLERNLKYHESKQEALDQFADIFHLKLIYRKI